MELITIILIAVIIAGSIYFGIKIGRNLENRRWLEEVKLHRKDAIMKSRSVLGGHFSENLAPFLPDFPYLPNECSFLGKPIDFLVFKGSDAKKIDEVVFVEVKSGNAKLNSQEKNLKEAIEKKKVKWEEYRIPEKLTGKRDIEDKIQDVVDGVLGD